MWVEGPPAYRIMESVYSPTGGAWSTPGVAGGSPTYPSHIHLAFNAKGAGILAWDDYDPSFNHAALTLSCALYDPAAKAWGPKRVVPHTVPGARDDSFGDWDVAFDAQGGALFAVSTGQGLWAVAGNPATEQWAAPSELAPFAAFYPRALPLPGGKALVAWRRDGGTSQGLTARLYDGSTGTQTPWAPAVDVMTDGPGAASSGFTCAADAAGNVLLAWRQLEGANLQGASIQSRRLTLVTGSWGPTTPVRASGPDLLGKPTLTLSPSGDILAFWGYPNTTLRLESNLFTSAGTWQGVKAVQPGTGPFLTVDSDLHAEAFDATGALMAVWLERELDGSFQTRFSLPTSGTAAWPTPVKLTHAEDVGGSIRCFSPSAGVWVRLWNYSGPAGGTHIWASEYR
jgi:hypothetical protein